MRPYHLIFGERLIQYADGRVGVWKGGEVVALPLHTLTHAHFKGMTGKGKSSLLASLCVSLIWQGIGVTLLDPAGELAHQVLSLLVATGYYDTHPDAFERVLFLDLPTAHKKACYLPFNILKGNYDPHSAASVVFEGFKRVWPLLQDGSAINIEMLVRMGAAVLAYNNLPLLPYLEHLYTDRNIQRNLLANTEDQRIRRWFKTLQLEPTDRSVAEIALTTLKRKFLFSFSPIVECALSQKENVLDFTDLLSNNRSVLLSMRLTDPDAKRLIGCLFTQQAEQVSKSLHLAENQKTRCVMIIDEMQNFVYQSGQALESMFAEARKAGVAVWVAHQYGEQLSKELKAALSQCGILVAFKLGSDDALVSVQAMDFPYNPKWVKEESGDPMSLAGTRKQFYSLDEQRAIHAGWIQNLPPQEAFIQLPDGEPERIRTITVDRVPDAPRIDQIKEEYLQRYFRPKDNIDREIQETLAELAKPSPKVTQSATLATATSPVSETQVVQTPATITVEPTPHPTPLPPSVSTPTPLSPNMEAQKLVEAETPGNEPPIQQPEDDYDFF